MTTREPPDSRAPQRHLLFDLDGTLIDGIDDLCAAINIVLTAHGLATLTRHELEPLLGDGMRMLAKRAFALRDVTLEGTDLDAATDAYVSAYRDTGYARTRLYDDVEATLRGLHASGWRIGLASNKLTEPCRTILSRLGVADLFTVVAGGDAAGARKPDPEHLRFALAGLGFDAPRGDRAVMVGDHANDVDAARGAGLVAIAVAFEVDATRAHSLGADAVLTRFNALPGALASLGL